MNSFAAAGLRRLVSVFFASTLATLFAAAPVHAQVQNKQEQACLTGLAKAGAGVARVQAKQNLTCLAAVAKGDPIPGGNAFACVTTDPDGKLAKAIEKTVTTDTKKCLDAPGFGYMGPVGINEAAANAERDLLYDLFGDFEAAAVECTSDAAGCACQAAVTKATEAWAGATIKTFLKCGKTVLKTGADDITDLDACVVDPDVAESIAADTKGQLAKKNAALDKAVAACTEAGAALSTLFAGDCSGSVGDTAFADCVENRIQCRTCELLEGTSALTVDCDLLDDGAANASCINFPGFSLRTLAGNIYLGGDSITSQVTADDLIPAAATNWFELVSDSGPVYVRNTGSGKFWRASGTSIFADADTTAGGTAWVVLAVDGTSPPQVVILRDGAISSTVDAVKYNSTTMSIEIDNEPISNVLDNPEYKFVMD